MQYCQQYTYIMDTTYKAEIISDLALGELNQREIAEKHSTSQQNISYYLKANKLEIEKVRLMLLSEVSKELMQRMVKEARKANKIVDAYDDGSLKIPSKEEQDYIKIHDNKIAGLIKGIIAPQTSDTNINVVKNESKTIISSDVLKMFQRGAKALAESVDDVIEAEVV